MQTPESWQLALLEVNQQLAACNTWMLMFVRAHWRYVYLPSSA